MNPAPIRESLVCQDGTSYIGIARWPQEWARFFAGLVRGFSWNVAYTTTLVKDFGSIAGGAEASQTVTVTGALVASNPDVIVTPSVNTAGIIYTGVVTANNVVTVYAKNFTSGNIDPASTTFRVTVLQV
jgi:hypothetical protein